MQNQKITPVYLALLHSTVQELRRIISLRINLLDGIICAALLRWDCGEGNRTETIEIGPASTSCLFPMLQGIGSSSNTILQLSDKPGLQTRDCYSILRSIIEGSINACYIMAEGEPAAEKAFRHVRQKAFRNLDRESVIADSGIHIFYSGKPKEVSPDLQKELDEFTCRKSRREKNWSDLSVRKRLQVIEAKLGKEVMDGLHLPYFATYADSSEILHGTLFGSFFFLGMTVPGQDTEPPELRFGHQHMMILHLCDTVLTAVVDAFHKVYGFQKVHARSKELTSRTNAVMREILEKKDV